jgi:hypothetical protein
VLREIQFLYTQKENQLAKKVKNLSYFHKDILRRSVLDFFFRGEFRALKTITFALKDETAYQGPNPLTSRILNSLGFKYK